LISEYDKTKSGKKHPRRPSSLFIPVIAVFASIALLIFSFYGHLVFRKTIVSQFQSHQLTIAKGAAHAIEGLFGRLTDEMLSLASAREVIDLNDPNLHQRIMDFYKVNQDIVYAGYRMNDKGVLVMMYPKDPKSLGANISKQAHVIKLFKTHRLVVSGLFMAVEGFNSVAIHAPVFNNKRFVGSVATIVKIDRISEEFLKDILAGRNGYAWLMDEDGAIVYHPEKKLIGKKISQTNLFTPSVRRELGKTVWRERPASFLLGGTLFSVAPFKIGSNNWSVVISTPYTDMSQPINRNWRNTLLISVIVTILMLIGGFALMTEAVKASTLEREKGFLEEKVGLEEELRSSRDKLDLIVKTIPSGLFTVSPDKTILTWNRTAERITGFPAEKVIGRKCTDIFVGSCMAGCALFDAAGPLKPSIGRECNITASNGANRILSKNVDYLRDAEGRVAGGIESFIDITDAKRAEQQKMKSIELQKEVEQLRKMDEVKTNFLSMVSHELRTPLSVMLGNLGMASKGKYGPLPDKFAEKLKVVLKRGWQLNELIDNLLDLAKIESGRMELDRQSIDLPSLFEEVRQEFAEDLEEKHLSLSISCALDAAMLEADKPLLRHLVVNLVGNSVKFTPENGSISISSFLSDGFPSISVKDTGIGIPENETSKIFDHFYQVDSSSTRQYGGTGLGLAIVQEIAKLHNADITVKSKLGEGTEMIVTFPPRGELFPSLGGSPMDEMEPKTPIKQLPPELASEPKAILLFDNDPEMLTTLTEFAEGSSIRILFSGDSRAARDIIGNDKIDMIFLDPANTGPDTAEFLRSIETPDSSFSPHVLVITSSPEATRDIESRFPQIAAFIPKPLKRSQFIKILKALSF